LFKNEQRDTALSFYKSMKRILLLTIVLFSLSAPSFSQAGIIAAASRLVKRTSDAVAGTCDVSRKGYTYFNTTTNIARICDGTAWGNAGGGAAGVGGSTGATDNAVLRADGVGGATLQNSLMTINDTGTVNIPDAQGYQVAGINVGTYSSGDLQIGSPNHTGTRTIAATYVRQQVGANQITGTTASGFGVTTAGQIGWVPGTDVTVTLDTGFSRQSAGVVKFTDGSSGSGSFTAKAGTFDAGTTAVAPINLTAGTNLTTPTAGAIEYDGKVFYKDFAASQRGVALTEQFVINSSDTTLTNGTGAQSIFAAANDTLTVLGSTTYEFEAQYYLTTGATTHTTATLFGGTATLTSIGYMAELWSVTDGTISTTAPSILRVAVGTSTVLNATSTATGTMIRLNGIVRVNAAGTFIPQIAFSADPTGTLLGKTNSYFRLRPLGTNTVTNIGPWN
jgi:hypothetical protein